MTQTAAVQDQRTIGAPVVSLAMPRVRREQGRLKDLPVDGPKQVLLADHLIRRLRTQLLGERRGAINRVL